MSGVCLRILTSIEHLWNCFFLGHYLGCRSHTESPSYGLADYGIIEADHESKGLKVLLITASGGGHNSLKLRYHQKSRAL